MDSNLNQIDPLLTPENCGFNRKYYKKLASKKSRKIGAYIVVILINYDSLKCTLEYYLKPIKDN